MNYRFYTILILYAIHGIGLWCTAYGHKKENKIKDGKSDIIGVNISRLIIILSPLLLIIFSLPKTTILWENLTYILGLAFCLTGFFLLVNARIILGKNFNSSPIVTEEQELITVGSYAIIRHPIYTSYILSWLGISFLTLNIIFSITIGIFVFRMIRRVKDEENTLIKVFGKKYISYKEKTGMFFPKTNQRNKHN